MEKVREQLLELIRSNLWGTPPSKELFDGDVDWPTLLKQARQQSVLGVAYSQLEHLDSEPEREVVVRLHTLTTLNRKVFFRQLQALDTITKRLAAIGIKRPVLLKGVGVSVNYLDPGTRQCGDIDLYVGKDDYEKACKAAQEWDESIITSKSMSRMHYHFIFDGTHVEIHRLACQNYFVGSHAAKFEQWCADNLEGDKVRHCTIEGYDVYLPPYNFDALYIFYHAWSHFCSYGISFRQISDWCRFLTVHSDKIDKEQLSRDLQYFGLVNPWGFFTSVGINLLGMSPDVAIEFDPSKEWHTDTVAQRIWNGGNFGVYSEKNALNKGFNIWVRKWKHFLLVFDSYSFLWSIDHKYALNFLLRLPVSLVVNNLFVLYYTLQYKFKKKA